MKVRPVVLFALVGALASCTESKIDTSDASAPTVSIKVRQADGQYAEVSDANLVFGGQVKLTAVVNDPQGVRSLKVQVLGSTSDSCTVQSTQTNGAFHLTPFPTTVQQDLQGDADGNVLTTLPLFQDIEDATCTVGSQKGRPLGHTITVKATAKNWSSNNAKNTATAQLEVHVN